MHALLASIWLLMSPEQSYLGSLRKSLSKGPILLPLKSAANLQLTWVAARPDRKQVQAFAPPCYPLETHLSPLCGNSVYRPCLHADAESGQWAIKQFRSWQAPAHLMHLLASNSNFSGNSQMLVENEYCVLIWLVFLLPGQEAPRVSRGWKSLKSVETLSVGRVELSNAGKSAENAFYSCCILYCPSELRGLHWKTSQSFNWKEEVLSRWKESFRHLLINIYTASELFTEPRYKKRPGIKIFRSAKVIEG